MKSLTIKTDTGTVEIKKLPIGKYSELLKAIKELPKHISGLETLKNDELISRLPSLIAEALPDFIAILTIASPLKKEEIEEMGLDEVTRIVIAIIEVNNFKEVYENIKKVTAPPQVKT